MHEREIEQQLMKKAKKRGGIALKFVSPSFAGMPDRLVLLPEGKIGFVELKAPGQNPRALQKARHEMLRKLGFKVFVPDNIGEIEEVLNEIQSP